MLFVISTSLVAGWDEVQGSPAARGGLGAEQRIGSGNRKRSREDEDDNDEDDDGDDARASIPCSRPPTDKDKPAYKKPMKAVVVQRPANPAQASSSGSRPKIPGSRIGSVPPPPAAPPSQSPLFSQNTYNYNDNNNQQDYDYDGGGARGGSGDHAGPAPATRKQTQPPLFFPGSQLSQADQTAIRESGLGIEDMGAEELEAMLEGEGEEVAFDFGSQLPARSEIRIPGKGGGERFEDTQDMEATQAEAFGSKVKYFFYLQCRVELEGRIPDV